METTSSSEPPAACTARSTLLNACHVWALRSPGPTICCFASHATCPDMNTSFPGALVTTWEKPYFRLGKSVSGLRYCFGIFTSGCCCVTIPPYERTDQRKDGRGTLHLRLSS